jgi:hypothetical protein
MEDALRAWREGERVLDTLPPLSPDHESVRLAIVDLRTTYQRVASLKVATRDVLTANREAIEEARQVIQDVAARAMRPRSAER